MHAENVIGQSGRVYRKSDWQDTGLKDRLLYLNHDMLVAYPELVRVINEVKRRIARCQLIEKGDCILIVAPTGAGKSFVIKLFRARHPPYEHPEWSERPEVDFNTPPRPSNSSMSEAFLTAIGAPEVSVGDARSKAGRCALLARSCKNQLTLVDNAHRIPEKRILGVREVGDWFCDLYDGAPTLLVILGADPVEEVLIANEQLRRRGLAVFHLDYFDLSTPPRTYAYARFLHQLDIALPLADMCGLARKNLLLRLLCATYGIIDLHVKLVGDAIEIAVSSGKESFGLEELACAYAQAVGDAHAKPNPFDPEFKPRYLTKSGELFADWLANARGRYAMATK